MHRQGCKVRAASSPVFPRLFRRRRDLLVAPATGQPRRLRENRGARPQPSLRASAHTQAKTYARTPAAARARPMAITQGHLGTAVGPFIESSELLEASAPG